MVEEGKGFGDYYRDAVQLELDGSFRGVMGRVRSLD